MQKKIRSHKRYKQTAKARKDLEKIFSESNHPLYTKNDTILAKYFNVSRLTIYSIRKELNIPCRYQRILNKLSSISTENYTITELALILKIKYKNLCKIIKKNNIKVKPDTPPIIKLLIYNRKRFPKKTI